MTYNNIWLSLDLSHQGTFEVMIKARENALIMFCIKKCTNAADRRCGCHMVSGFVSGSSGAV